MCHLNATCVNSTNDSMHCKCNTGFDGNGINCTSKYVWNLTERFSYSKI